MKITVNSRESILIFFKLKEQFHKSKRWYTSEKFDTKFTIINDGSTSNETRLGAVADIKAGLGSNYNEDVLIIAGDTLFMEDFKLLEFVKQFHEFKKVSAQPVEDRK